MSSTAPVTATPAAPATASAATTTGIIASLVDSWGAFVKAHEKIVLTLIFALLTYHFYGSAINAWIHHDDLVAVKDNAVVSTDDVKFQALTQSLVVMQKELDTQSATIQQAIVQRTVQTQTQVKTDATLPLPDLATRWSTLLELSPTDFSAEASGNISVNPEGAHATVAQLEQVPTLTANNAALTTQTQSQAAVISKQTDSINACTTELTDEKKAHVADVAAVKAQNKKSWLNGFKWGVVTGFFGGLFAAHSANL